MLLRKYRLKKLRRVVLGIRGVGYDLGLGAPEVSIPVKPSGPQLLHHVISRFSFFCDQESNSCFASVLENWEFFLSLVQFIFLSKLSIRLRFDHTIVCLINPFLMEKYFWTLTQPDTSDTIKPAAHGCEMQVSTDVQSNSPECLSLSYIWPPIDHISVQF